MANNNNDQLPIESLTNAQELRKQNAPSNQNAQAIRKPQATQTNKY